MLTFFDDSRLRAVSTTRAAAALIGVQAKQEVFAPMAAMEAVSGSREARDCHGSPTLQTRVANLDCGGVSKK
jgi:hypothetical protein